MFQMNPNEVGFIMSFLDLNLQMQSASHIPHNVWSSLSYVGISSDGSIHLDGVSSLLSHLQFMVSILMEGLCCYMSSTLTQYMECCYNVCIDTRKSGQCVTQYGKVSDLG